MRHADGTGNHADQGRNAVGGGEAFARQRLEGENDQRIAGQHRGGLAEDRVQAWLAAADIRVIETGQVVMDQRCAMQQLDGGCRGA